MLSYVPTVAACLLAWTLPSWRPVAVALGGSLALDLVAVELRLDARPDLAVWLATPALSSWCAWRVLVPAASSGAPVFAAWSLAGALVCYAPAPSSWWHLVPPLARFVSIVAQVEAVRRWWRAGRPGAPAAAPVAALLAGDLLSLLGPAGLVPGPWSLAAAQGIVVATGIAALWTVRANRPSPGR